MQRILIIAEIAQAHDGSLGILHSFIDAVAKTGVDAIKFQTHIADAESSEFEPFRVNFSYVDKTRFDYWKRMEFTEEQWFGIKKHCDEMGIEFLSSPFSIAAVDLLEMINVRRYKIGSGEVNNFLMLEKIAKTGKEIILSSGMSSLDELESTFNFLKKFGNSLSILQCTTKYPTQPEDIGLNLIPVLRNRYQVPIGLSDHSGTIYPSIAAVGLGAEIIEIHVTFDKQMFGPDSSSSLTLSELKQLVEGVRFIERCINNPIDDKGINTTSLKTIFEKSLALRRDLPKGSKICFDDLESKKPSGIGIPAREYQNIIGKQLVRDKSKNDFLKEEDLI